MPTKEMIAPSPAQTTTAQPQQFKDIPVRIVSTKSVKPVEEKKVVQENANQQNKVEDKKVAESAPPAESVALSENMSAAARKEQAFRARERQLAEREQKISGSEAKAKRFDEIEAAIKAKDFIKLDELGFEYSEYVKYQLEKPAADDPHAKDIKEVRGELAQMRKEQEEKAEREYEETKTAYRSEITKVVDDNPDFSSIKELKLQENVLKLILDAWEEDEEQMSVEEACKEIENFIVEQGKKLSTLPKLKPAAPTEEKKLPPPRRVSTLTNDMSPAAPARPNVPLHKLSDAERILEARRRVQARKQAQG